MSIVSVQQAVESLTQGHTVAIPTETVYGLAGRIDREETLKQIFAVKSRPFFDPLIVHVASIEQARTLAAEWNEVIATLTETFWPGPLTVVVPKTDSVSSLITSGLDSVGLRLPKHPIALEILKKVGIPLAAPSANRFGRTSPTRAEHVESEFSGRIEVVDGGSCEVGVESTVLTAKKNGDTWLVEILRPGGVSQKQISDLLTEKRFKFTLQRAHSVASPGHLKAHYQPESPVVITSKKITDEDLKFEIEKRANIKISEIKWLHLPSDPALAARELYQSFRNLSKERVAIAVAKLPIHDSEDWQSVWDRIDRAAILHLS